MTSQIWFSPSPPAVYTLNRTERNRTEPKVENSVTKLESAKTACVTDGEEWSLKPPDSRFGEHSGNAGLSRRKSSFPPEQGKHDEGGDGNSESESEGDSASDFEFAFADDTTAEFSGTVKESAGEKTEDDRKRNNEALLLSLGHQNDRDDDGKSCSKSDGPLVAEKGEENKSNVSGVVSTTALAATTIPGERVARVVAPRRLDDRHGQHPTAREEESECDHDEAGGGERRQEMKEGEDEEPAWASLVESDGEGDSDDDLEDKEGQSSSSDEAGEVVEAGAGAVRCPQRYVAVLCGGSRKGVFRRYLRRI